MNTKSNGSKTNSKAQVVSVKQVANEDEDLNHDYWHPTSDQLGQFVQADIKHATANLVQAMAGRGEMSMRDLKEVLLHSIDVIERALVSMIASGKVKENRSRYQLVVLS